MVPSVTTESISPTDNKADSSAEPAPSDQKSDGSEPVLNPVRSKTAGPIAASKYSIVEEYRAQLTGFDEMIGADGSVRAHWQPLIAALERQGPSATSAISERIQRRIVENGITLDSFSDPTNAEQPWKLDLVPLIFPSDEWHIIEQAMIQRARLFEALLSDLYGPQQMLTEGLVPSELVFNDPAYLRPMHGIQTSSKRLMFMAVDLARDFSGNWRIVDTHAETIAGHGYAVANRVVLADIRSRVFRECNALRISQFYQDVAQELAVRSGSAAPTVAILGPNPENSTYLSHAYMARYLGYQLLQGSDLRVVGGKVYQKTLAGLQSIDLIVRAVQASQSDPLELEPSGFDGPPGLVQAVRENPSLIANSLGTAIVENRGLAPYIAGLSERLIGEAPLFPDAERLWLGDRATRDAVLADHGDFLLRPAFEETGRPGHARPGAQLSAMDDTARAALISEVHSNGAKFVAERPSQFATAPSWTPEGLAPKAYALRVFVAATAEGYSVMPGGIALTIDTGTAVAMSSSAAQSRDVWVSAGEVQGPHYSRWRLSEEESQVQRFGALLPSRIADNLFWLGRYVERADWTLRVMRSALHHDEDDLRPVRRTDAAESALDILIMKGRPSADIQANLDSPASLDDRVQELFDAIDRPYGIPATFRNIRSVARQSRDRLSSDAWRLLNGLTIEASTDNKVDASEISLDLIDRVNRRISELAAFNGLMHENMTRNFGWHFLDIGRRIERALQMAELLRTLLLTAMNESDETERLAFLLETTDSFMTYRARYRFAPTFPLVLDLLMVDETNPRGLAYQLATIDNHLSQLPKASTDAVRTPEQRLSLELLSQVRLADLNTLRGANENGQRSELVSLLDLLMNKMPELSDIISRRYFSLTEEQPHRVHTRLAH
jgi:uncharacterized circularly permuted ATP-grasp superfamily protein/uncharacterized alpha-E superfamily protein